MDSDKKVFIFFVILVGVIILASIAAFIGIVFGVFWIIGHPEAIGQFFGAISAGFNSAAK